MPSRCLTLLAILAVYAPSAKAASLYHIGNSLTVDSNPGAVLRLAELAGFEATSGFHAMSNSTLGQIWDDPQGYTSIGGSYGAFDTALPGAAWDHVILQSSDNAASTLGEDLEVFDRYVQLAQQNPANADTQFYVYAPWPWTFRWDEWENVSSPVPHATSWHRKQYFENFTDFLNAETSGLFNMIPVGLVYATIRDRIDGQAFGGIRHISRLHRDAIHANQLGSFVAATTIFATVFKTDPTGLPVPRDVPGWTEERITDEVALELQQLIWEIVVDEKRTGVSPWGDINTDTRVDGLDFDLWRAAYGARTEVTHDLNGDDRVDAADEALWHAATVPGDADLDGNGEVSQGDFEFWKTNYGAESGTTADANHDGRVDAIDYTIWRDQVSLMEAADLDQDGVLAPADLELLHTEMGWRADLPEDINSDGVVNAIDYTIWRDNLPPQSAATGATLPEPGGAALLLLALSAACPAPLRRR